MKLAFAFCTIASILFFAIPSKLFLAGLFLHLPLGLRRVSIETFKVSPEILGLSDPGLL